MASKLLCNIVKVAITTTGLFLVAWFSERNVMIGNCLGYECELLLFGAFLGLCLYVLGIIVPVEEVTRK